jgi:DNA-binding CsgD family transcriptional regulator
MSRVEAAFAAAGLSDREQRVAWGLARGQSLSQVAVELGMRSKQLAHYTA